MMPCNDSGTLSVRDEVPRHAHAEREGDVIRLQAEVERLRVALRKIDAEVNYRTGWDWAEDIHKIVQGALSAALPGSEQ